MTDDAAAPPRRGFSRRGRSGASSSSIATTDDAAKEVEGPVSNMAYYTAARKIMPESAKGYHEGREGLPEGLRQRIGEHEMLKDMGDVVAFSGWDDAYMQKYQEYQLGHNKFALCFTPCGCPQCIPCIWTICLPCLLCDRCFPDVDNAQMKARAEGSGYHIIFPHHYVWLTYVAETDAGKEKLTLVKIIPNSKIEEAVPIANVDEHLRDGVCGCIQDAQIPDMPGVLIKAPMLGGETFKTWTTYRGRDGRIHGYFEEQTAKCERRAICDGEAFVGKLMTQMAWCEENAPPPQQSMEAPLPGHTEHNEIKDKAAGLRELKALLDEGVLTEEEFAAEKAKVLGNSV